MKSLSLYMLIFWAISFIAVPMHAKVVHISSHDQHQKLIKSNKPVVTMYSADWCGPCKQTKPHFAKAAETYTDITFAMVDMGNKALKGAVKGITGLPTMIFSHNGKEVMKERGGRSRGELQSSINFFKQKVSPPKSNKKAPSKKA